MKTTKNTKRTFAQLDSFRMIPFTPSINGDTMESEKVHLTKEHETYLSTVYGKALDNRAENPILGDRFADEALQKINFNFKKLKLPSGGEITLPIRAKHFDTWSREFLATHPQATVLHLGCGLDSRVFRIDPPATVRWYDVDFPDVIELRRRLYPERHDYTMIPASVTEPGWLDTISSDQPVLVVGEGLLQHLSEKDAFDLLNRITEHFPSGQILFDIYSRLTVRLLNFAVRLSVLGQKPTDAGDRVDLSWGLNDPQEVIDKVPRLRLVSTICFLTMPELVDRMSSSKFQKWVGGILTHTAWYRNAMQHMRFEF
jgi:O-methyltransferase involved in polyketide biosynthesis